MSSYDIPNASGIYRIVCVPTGKLYLGSAVNIRNRWKKHRHQLLHKVHHSVTLQRAWEKYGPDAFIFEVVELVLVPFLLEREQYWLDVFKPYDPAIGFNIDRVAGSRIGHTPSIATRDRLREANLGKKHTEEAKRKMSVSQTGRTHRPESKEKVRLIRLGTKRSPETIERLRTSHLGITPSDESREKRSLALTGHVVSNEARAKISETNITSNAWRMKTIIATAPDGTVYTATGIGQFCKEHSLNRSALIQVAKGKAPHHKGWTARYSDGSTQFNIV